MRKLVALSIGVSVLVIAVIATPQRDKTPAYELAAVNRGEAITKVVSAGTVQPVLSVVVSSQVSGQVKEVLVEHNDAVKEGQPIALLDPQLFAIRVQQARTEVDVASDAVRIAKDEVTTAEAGVNRVMAERAKTAADAKRYEVTVNLTRLRLERKSSLIKSGATTLADAEDARAAYDSALAELDAATAQVASQEARLEEARAQLGVMRSRIAHSEAQVRRSEAALHQAEADLDRTVIRAPMDGIVIERSVAAGQTVAASFQAPPLFTIGDLRTVNVEIAVDEADIGGIRVGQNVTFSVDAYPDQAFAGRVTQVRKSPHVQESVVTYTVVATANNDDLLLFPGMTAKADIIIGDTPDALQVPSSALRYRPRGAPPPAGSQVWVSDNSNGSIRPVAVRVGVSNNGMTEIVSGSLSEGDRVIVGDAEDRTGSSSGAISQISAKVAEWIEPLQAAFTVR